MGWKTRSLALALMCLAPAAAIAQQQQPKIGIEPVELTQSEYVFDTAEQHKIRVVVVAKGLKNPFAVALLPNGDALVSERGLDLRLVRNASGAAGKPAILDPEPIAGVPPLEPAYRGGGLYDVVLHPGFAKNKLIYFTYNKPGQAPDPSANPPQNWKSRITLLRGKLSGHTLTSVEELFVGGLGGTSASRIAFGRDGMIYMTTGGPFGGIAQDLGSDYGKVLRLTQKGKAPSDNPFVGRDGALPEIFSYGHRDQFGMAVHPVTGQVLNAEHGPNGGDEVNLILAGHNYGWPLVSFGRAYEGPRISEEPVAPGIDQPLIVWLPSIAPTQLAIYNSDRFPNWKGNFFVASARRGEIDRTGGLERVVVNDKLEELRRETLLSELHQRIQAVQIGRDGLIYVLTDERAIDSGGALLRIEPAI